MNVSFRDSLRNLMSLRTTSDDLLNIDIIRFIASAGVVICHSGEFFLDRTIRSENYDRIAGLALFVDVFFIISGFVITHVYSEKTKNLRQFLIFMQRRIGRLIPLHFATLLCVSLIFLAVNLLHVKTNTDMRLVPACLVLGTFLLQSAFECGGHVPNGVSWSISAEMVMYVCFPLLIVLAKRFGRLRYLIWISFFAFVVWRNPPGIDWSIPTHFWRALPAFFFGIALRLDWDSWARVPLPSWISPVLALALIVGSFSLWPNWLLLVLVYGVAIAAVISDGRRDVSKFTRLFAPLGQLTYSIYMLHPVIIIVLVNAFGDKLLKLEPLPLSLLTLASYPVIAAASLLSYKWFETPARRYIDGLRLIQNKQADEVA
jgi:peptidoglycan/LPS O-acetylase OafA/YrhL